MSDKSQKTEKPTPQRRREAVREGRIARSADVSAWLTVLAVSFLAPVTVRHTRELFIRGARSHGARRAFGC